MVCAYLINYLIYFGLLLTLLYVLRGNVLYFGMYYIINAFFLVWLVLYGFSFFNFVLEDTTVDFNFILLKSFTVDFDISINFRIDGLNFLFSLLVLIIGFSTNLYYIVYMKNETNIENFILYLNFFIFGMIVLLFANNFFTLILGWELIGLFSFFLINFWNFRKSTLKSSFKAFMFNKISDLFLLLFVVITVKTSHTSNLDQYIHLLETKSILNDTSPTILLTSACCLIICSSIKSAQIGFHVWLPDSMEAPVPASALIHSATLVSAGIYLLMRFNFLLSLTDTLWVVVWLGSITAFFGAITSSTQTDLKRILAYSTISHCGFMFVCIGLNLHQILLIYLYLHGLFKAGSFFCCGSIIKLTSTQDFREMGNVSSTSPLDTTLLIIFISNLCGLPLTFGYLYKKYLLLSLFTHSISTVCLIFLYIGMLCSLIYMYRIIFYTCFDYNKTISKNQFHKNLNNTENYHKNYSASTQIQFIALLILLWFAIFMYIFFYNFFLTSDLSFSVTRSVLFNKVEYASIPDFYKSSINVFYVLYLLIYIICNLPTWRKSFTTIVKIEFFLTSIQFITFLVWMSYITGFF